MPRTTRSTPAPPQSEGATAPVPAAPAVRLPNPNPDRAAATLVDSATTLEDLPCFIPGALGAGMVLGLERVILATGGSCAAGSHSQVSCALGWVAMRFSPRPGADTWPQVLEAAEKRATSSRGGASRAYREVEATRLMVRHILDLL